MCVHPATRRTGVARVLTAQLERGASLLGYRGLLLSTLQQFAPARQLYAGCGFGGLDGGAAGLGGGVPTAFAGATIHVVSMGKVLSGGGGGGGLSAAVGASSAVGDEDL